ncbi:MAG TPA: hypothetical protein VNJ11_05435 [Bryobacteraceae bacterium]|nr:hypothetical protein [Bryobacteraceae bacterium]
MHSTATLKLPDVNFAAVKATGSGALIFLAPDRWGIHILPRPAEKPISFTLHSAPEVMRAHVESKSDFAVDARGNIYVPATWLEWKSGAGAKSGVFVFDWDGRHKATVVLDLEGSPERIAVDAAGQFYVLSLDAAWAKGRRKDCFLVHKFAQNGKRLGAFSSCPATEGASYGTPEFQSRLMQLREETARGHLWVEDGLVYHVFPRSRVVRVFDTAGALIREIALAPPDSADLLAPSGLRADPASNQVGRILRLRDGRWLIEWLHMERTPGRERRTTFLSLHGEDGRPLSKAAHPPSRPSIPVGTDAVGDVCFLSLKRSGAGPAAVELISAAVELH